MVQLNDRDIATREVLDWKGLHLFHALPSSCSQKTRIFLNLKGAPWESHVVNLGNNENMDAWYLGINPRGLVPALVMDGAVHIESNDIMTLLDGAFPEPKLIPEGRENEMGDLLHHEDDLHLDLRTITFRFTRPQGKAPKSPEALDSYRAGGTGTVGGREDANKKREIDFWEAVARDSISDEAIRVSASKFRTALDDIDGRLTEAEFLLGETLSVLDIAWFIYVNRLVLCGYPLARLHPNAENWFQALRVHPEFFKEVQVPAEYQASLDANRRQQEKDGATLEQVAGL
ncbi:MAG: glutathione S-transferase family protein [Rhodospirillales bacterium]|nr:glutathione S-transferase family protein [Rhodospirillales bacterium]